jgi:hypothetical protein
MGLGRWGIFGKVGTPFGFCFDVDVFDSRRATWQLVMLEIIMMVATRVTNNMLEAIVAG